MNLVAFTMLLLAALSGYQLWLAFGRGYVHGRFRRHIYRHTEPNLFWFNVIVYGLFAIFGLFWAAFHARSPR